MSAGVRLSRISVKMENLFAFLLLLGVIHLVTGGSPSSEGSWLSKATNSLGKARASPGNPFKVGVIGGGNWGTTVARHLARVSPAVDVAMWCHEERLADGRNLTDAINADHCNQKYLPGVELPKNVAACAELAAVCSGADALFFVVPHQYLPGVLDAICAECCEDVKDSSSNVSVLSRDVLCVSLTKGMSFKGGVPDLLSTRIGQTLGLRRPVAVLMGANVASDVAEDAFVETTVACSDPAVAAAIGSLVRCPTFYVELSRDVAAVEILGALKNVVALAAGFCDGLQQGESTKAAIVRRGLAEAAAFCDYFAASGAGEKGSADNRDSSKDGDVRQRLDTIMSSAGVADIIATCYGGRNRRCAAEFAVRLRAEEQQQNLRLQRSEADVATLWRAIEVELLGGQSLQGVETCRDVVPVMQAVWQEFEHKATAAGMVGGAAASPPARPSDAYDPRSFSLFRKVYAIAVGGAAVESILEWD